MNKTNMSLKQNDHYEEAKMEAEQEKETKCNVCNKMYFIQESYGVNGTDEFYATEVGHDFYCIYRNIDPMNRPFVEEVKHAN